MASQKATSGGTPDSSTQKLSGTTPVTTEDATPRVSGHTTPVRVTVVEESDESDHGKAVREPADDKCPKPNGDKKCTKVEMEGTNSVAKVSREPEVPAR